MTSTGGEVFPVALSDQGDELGEMCPVCLAYLNQRKEDEDDPMLGNWPARGWPSLEDLEEARRHYPEAMYPTRADLEAATTDEGGEDRIHDESVVYGMERYLPPR